MLARSLSSFTAGRGGGGGSGSSEGPFPAHMMASRAAPKATAGSLQPHSPAMTRANSGNCGGGGSSSLTGRRTASRLPADAASGHVVSDEGADDGGLGGLWYGGGGCLVGSPGAGGCGVGISMLAAASSAREMGLQTARLAVPPSPAGKDARYARAASRLGGPAAAPHAELDSGGDCGDGSAWYSGVGVLSRSGSATLGSVHRAKPTAAEVAAAALSGSQSRPASGAPHRLGPAAASPTPCGGIVANTGIRGGFMRSNSNSLTASSLASSSPLQRTSSKPICAADLGFLLCTQQGAVDDGDRSVNCLALATNSQGPQLLHRNADYAHLRRL